MKPKPATGQSGLSSEITVLKLPVLHDVTNPNLGPSPRYARAHLSAAASVVSHALRPMPRRRNP